MINDESLIDCKDDSLINAFVVVLMSLHRIFQNIEYIY